MTIQLTRPADLLGMVGQEIGTGEWHAITQHQVNIFADATHDHQWIHVEPQRAVNYGVNRVRFPAPVPVGSRIRGHVTLVSAERKWAGLECAFGILVELEGSDRPACVIETVVIYR